MTMTRGVHDLGGLSAGPVDLSEHERTFFDQRVDAVMRLLTDPESGYFTVDAMRRAIESLPGDDYFGLGYYERWVRVIRQLALETGLISEDDLARKLAEFGTALPGDIEIRVVDSTADTRYMVLPQRPRCTERLSEAELAALVTRDSMIGVTVLPEPRP